PGRSGFCRSPCWVYPHHRLSGATRGASRSHGDVASEQSSPSGCVHLIDLVDLRRNPALVDQLEEEISRIAGNHGLTLEDLQGPRRDARLVEARRRAAELLRDRY